MTDAETMNFGPQWLRQLSDTGNGGGNTVPMSATAGGKYKLADYKYSRDKMLMLYVPNDDPPDYLSKFPEILQLEPQVPMSLRELTEIEQQLIMSQNVNSQNRKLEKLAPGTGRGRGDVRPDRGRGRGRRGGGPGGVDFNFPGGGDEEEYSGDRSKGKGRFDNPDDGGEWRRAPGTRQRLPSNSEEDNWRRKDNRPVSGHGMPSGGGRGGYDGGSRGSWRQRTNSGGTGGPSRDAGSGRGRDSQQAFYAYRGSRRTGDDPNPNDSAPTMAFNGTRGGAPWRRPQRVSQHQNADTEDIWQEDWDHELDSRHDEHDPYDDFLDTGEREQEEWSGSREDHRQKNSGRSENLSNQQSGPPDDHKTGQKNPGISESISNQQSVSPEAVQVKQPKVYRWNYRDPQGNIQGPFTNEEMKSWLDAGFFTPALILKRECDATFSYLADYNFLFERNCFSPGKPIPPLAPGSLPVPSPLVATPSTPIHDHRITTPSTGDLPTFPIQSMAAQSPGDPSQELLKAYFAALQFSPNQQMFNQQVMVQQMLSNPTMPDQAAAILMALQQVAATSSTNASLSGSHAPSVTSGGLLNQGVGSAVCPTESMSTVGGGVRPTTLVQTTSTPQHHQMPSAPIQVPNSSIWDIQKKEAEFEEERRQKEAEIRRREAEVEMERQSLARQQAEFERLKAEEERRIRELVDAEQNVTRLRLNEEREKLQREKEAQEEMRLKLQKEESERARRQREEHDRERIKREREEQDRAEKQRLQREQKDREDRQRQKEQREQEEQEAERQRRLQRAAEEAELARRQKELHQEKMAQMSWSTLVKSNEQEDLEKAKKEAEAKKKREEEHKRQQEELKKKQMEEAEKRRKLLEEERKKLMAEEEKKKAEEQLKQAKQKKTKKERDEEIRQRQWTEAFKKRQEEEVERRRLTERLIAEDEEAFESADPAADTAQAKRDAALKAEHDRIEAEKRRREEEEKLAQFSLPQTAHWATGGNSSGQAISLSQIQRAQASGADDGRVAVQPNRQHQNRSTAQTHKYQVAAPVAPVSTVWGHSGGPKKTLSEIQAEEAEMERKEKTHVDTSGSVNRTDNWSKKVKTGNPPVVVASVPTPTPQPAKAQPTKTPTQPSSTSVWDLGGGSTTKSLSKPPNKKTSGTTKKSGPAAEVERILQQTMSASEKDGLTEWCKTALQDLTQNLDIDLPTLVEILRDTESPLEVDEFIKQYFGNTPRTSQFTKDFLVKRKEFSKSSGFNSGARSGGAVQGNNNTIQNNSKHSDDQWQTQSSKAAAGGKKNKKKNKKMQQVNTKLLGFTCAPDPNRPNHSGEIERD